MADEQSWLREELNALRTLRDELRVQTNLAAKEARDHFETAEKHWREFESRAKYVGQESKEILEDVGEAGVRLLKEIREAYQKIRALL